MWKKSKALGEVWETGIKLTREQYNMLNTLAKDKYRFPQSKSHVVRLIIEEAYKTYMESVNGGKNGSSGDELSI